MRGEKIYVYDPDVTGVTDYGVTLEAVLSGQERVPPQGVRINVAFEGRAKLHCAGHRYSRNSFSHSDLLEEETPRLTFPFLSDPDSRQGAL